MLNPFRVGLVIGTFLAIWHACWSILVATGVAQKVIDFIFWMHFIVPPYRIEPFDILRACILVGVTFFVGLVIGTIAGLIWNAVHQTRQIVS
jgi:MFS superfamily sulfate permease-like transporter